MKRDKIYYIAKFEENEIVHQFFHHLEQTIQQHPDNWLWSHKRWKYADL